MTSDRATRRAGTATVALSALLVLLIALLDALTPAGVVVGILLSVPIIGSSLSPRREHVWLIGGLAIVCFILAALFGVRPISPRAVWLPNRVFVLVSLPAVTLLAAWLQTTRLRIEAARDEAVRAVRMNQLLLSLLAHDLRAPIALTGSALEYVLSRPEQLDHRLIENVSARIRRSLATLDRLIAASAGREGQDSQTAATITRELLMSELSEEAMAARAEGALREKTVAVQTRADVGGVASGRVRADLEVAKQGLGILVDNAIRHADPGLIQVRLQVDDERLAIEVEDQGPGVGNAPPDPAGTGSGLNLCRSLAALAGGELQLVRTGPRGSLFRLTLPVRSA